MKKTVKLSKNVQKNIVDFVSKELYERHMSQRELGEKMGVSKQHIQSILSGKKGFTFKTLDKMSKALNLNISIILEDENIKEK